MPFAKIEILVDFLQKPRFLCRQVHSGDTSNDRPAGAIGNVIYGYYPPGHRLPRFAHFMGRKMGSVANFSVASPELF